MTTPLGGDAQTHIQVARYPFEDTSKRTHLIREDALRNSRYPLASAMFASTRILPLDWETRFTVWMALGHMATGLAIGLLLFRIGGIWPAIIGILFWSASAMEVLPFFRSATMPQLWSLPFLTLFIERIVKRSWLWSLPFLAAVYYTHPATFAVAALATGLALPAMLIYRYARIPHKQIAAAGTTAITAGAALIILFFFAESIPYAEFNFHEPWSSLAQMLSSRFGPVLLLAPLGMATFALMQRVSFEGRFFLLTFSALTFFLSINETFGGTVPEKRLVPYTIVVAVMFGAIGLHAILKNSFSSNRIKLVAASAVLAVVTLGSWHNAAAAYYAFEHDCNFHYPCPTTRPAEREAYEWIRNNLPQNAVLVANERRGRVTEWIPIAADRGIDAPRFSSAARVMLTETSCKKILARISGGTRTHAIFYTQWDTLPEPYELRPDVFRVLFQNDEVKVIAFPEQEAIDSPEKRATLCQL